MAQPAGTAEAVANEIQRCNDGIVDLCAFCSGDHLGYLKTLNHDLLSLATLISVIFKMAAARGIRIQNCYRIPVASQVYLSSTMRIFLVAFFTNVFLKI